MTELEKAIAMLAENQAKMTETMQTLTQTLSPKQDIPKQVKVTQINVGDKTFFCTTQEEEMIFFENNPEAKKYMCTRCHASFEEAGIQEDRNILICPKCSSGDIFVNTETHSYELPEFIAEKYLNDPENKKQFTRKQFARKEK